MDSVEVYAWALLVSCLLCGGAGLYGFCRRVEASVAHLRPVARPGALPLPPTGGSGQSGPVPSAAARRPGPNRVVTVATDGALSAVYADDPSALAFVDVYDTISDEVDLQPFEPRPLAELPDYVRDLLVEDGFLG